MESKKEDEMTTQNVSSLTKETSSDAHPPNQIKTSGPTPQIEDPKSLITKIDNRFKTKVRLFSFYLFRM